MDLYPQDLFTDGLELPSVNGNSTRTENGPAPVHQSLSMDEWLVDGRLRRRGTSLLAGALDAGKSTLARQLSLAVARGEPWLNLGTRPGSVLYVYLDGPIEELRRSFTKLGLELDDPVHLLSSREPAGLLELVRQSAKALDPALIVIDGLRPLLHGEQLTGSIDDRTALERILALAREARCHLLLTHDLAGSLTDDMSQLLAQAPCGVDTMLLLNRLANRRLLRTIQLAGCDVAEPISVPSLGTPEPVDPANLPDQILACLRSRRQLATLSEICQHVRTHHLDQVDRALRKLQTDGRLIRVGRGSAAEPYLYTGFDRVANTQGKEWLRRVRPWASVRRTS